MKINLNHWYVKNNELSISLMNFYASISIYKNDNLCFVLRINNWNMEDIYLYFNTLEEVISFTETKIVNSRTFEEILILYKEHYCGKHK